jgi:hypothetical protein
LLTLRAEVAVPSYMVEAYMPCSQVREAHAAARRVTAAAVDLSRDGTDVRHVRTTFLPDDETCFHLVEAPSTDAVKELSCRARLGRTRIVRAVEAR